MEKRDEIRDIYRVYNIHTVSMVLVVKFGQSQVSVNIT